MAHANKKQIALYVTEEENEKVTLYAEKIGISRQRLLSNILNNGLEELEAMDKYKILGMSVTVRDLYYKIKYKLVDPKVITGEEHEQS